MYAYFKLVLKIQIWKSLPCSNCTTSIGLIHSFNVSPNSLHITLIVAVFPAPEGPVRRRIRHF